MAGDELLKTVSQTPSHNCMTGLTAMQKWTIPKTGVFGTRKSYVEEMLRATLRHNKIDLDVTTNPGVVHLIFQRG